MKVDAIVSALMSYQEFRREYVLKTANAIDADSPTYTQLEGAWAEVGRAVLEVLGLPTIVTPEEFQTALSELLEAKWSVMRLAPPPLREIVLDRDRHQCCQCGSTRAPLHVDHIVPFSAGGLTVKSNLRTLCSICNIKKGASFK